MDPKVKKNTLKNNGTYSQIFNLFFVRTTALKRYKQQFLFIVIILTHIGQHTTILYWWCIHKNPILVTRNYKCDHRFRNDNKIKMVFGYVFSSFNTLTVTGRIIWNVGIMYNLRVEIINSYELNVYFTKGI